ncbi:MAG: hypothetical protein ABIQ27_05380 [Flavobacterium sp.]|uniref:hypothetical protein n=1 Tax=Flavobacterium sp. TaxID=239 RepID=UPI003266026B
MGKRSLSALLCLFVILIIVSCGTSKQPDEKYLTSKNKVLNIKEFNSVFLLKSISQSGSDTTYILSAKKDILKKAKLPYSFSNDAHELIVDGVYNFQLSPVRFRSSSMENLGVYLVFDNDTLYKGANSNGRKYFLSHNSIGLLIENK